MTLLRASRATWCRGAAAVAAAVAAWGPAAPWERAPALRVLVTDVSASTGLDGPRPQDLAALREGAGRRDRCAVVVFGESARVVAPPASADGLVVSGARPGRWASSLAAGLRAAASLRAQDERMELRIVTDGCPTDAPSAIDDAVALVRSAGGAEASVALLVPAERPAAVRTLRGPGRASAGETFTLEASGDAGPGGVTVELVESGRVVESRRVDAPGAFRLLFARTADGVGVRTWEARVRGPGEVPPASARVVVAEPGSTAIVHDGRVRPELASAVGRVAVAIDATASTGDQVLAAVSGCDAVVVDAHGADPAPLLRFVRGGGGLLLVDSHARQDGVSPLLSVPPEEEGTFLYVAIDGSGSMGEPWPGDRSSLPRDVAVRSAADALVRDVPAGTRLVLRRFRETLVPEGPPTILELGRGPRDDAVRTVRALPAPGGSTAFLPVLRDAFEVVASRSEPRRAVILLTDGRSAESVDELRAAVDRLLDARIRVAVVVPGPLDGPRSEAPLLAAFPAAGTLFVAAESGRLGAVLAEAEDFVRGANESLHGVALEAVPEAAPLVTPADVPSRAEAMTRRFLASDAAVLVRTSTGDPFAAIRREGAGSVAALVRAVRRPAAADVRVETGDGIVRLRWTGPAGGAAPAVARWMRGAAEVGADRLRPTGDGVLEVPLPEGGADFVSFRDDHGVERAASGLDRPAPAEAGDVPQVDLASLASRLRPAERQPSHGLRAPLAALAVLLLIAGSVKSGARPAR